MFTTTATATESIIKNATSFQGGSKKQHTPKYINPNTMEETYPSDQCAQVITANQE